MSNDTHSARRTDLGRQGKGYGSNDQSSGSNYDNRRWIGANNWYSDTSNDGKGSVAWYKGRAENNLSQGGYWQERHGNWKAKQDNDVSSSFRINPVECIQDDRRLSLAAGGTGR